MLLPSLYQNLLQGQINQKCLPLYLNQKANKQIKFNEYNRSKEKNLCNQTNQSKSVIQTTML